MINRVDATADTPRSAQTAGGPTAKPSRSFAEAHAAAVSAAATPSSVTTASDEVWTPVPGVSSYAKITSGPRTGQDIDLTKGAHHGRVFTIEERAGKTVHVFKKPGGGEDVVDAGADKKAKASADGPVKGETWGPVKGHSGYADILSGKRNGLFVNVSGGPRAGQAFQLEHHGDKDLHIYGEGKDRKVVAVPVTDSAAKPKAADSTGGAASS